MSGAKDQALLSSIITNVYIPTQKNRQEIKATLQKYVSQITHFISQVTGTQSIRIPTNIEPDEEVAIKNKELIEEYERYLVSHFSFFFFTIYLFDQHKINFFVDRKNHVSLFVLLMKQFHI